MDSWLSQYDACARQGQEIMEQITSRNKQQKGSSAYTKQTAHIRVAMREFSQDVVGLREDLMRSARLSSVYKERQKGADQHVELHPSRSSQSVASVASVSCRTVTLNSPEHLMQLSPAPVTPSTQGGMDVDDLISRDSDDWDWEEDEEEEELYSPSASSITAAEFDSPVSFENGVPMTESDEEEPIDEEEEEDNDDYDSQQFQDISSAQYAVCDLSSICLLATKDNTLCNKCGMPNTLQSTSRGTAFVLKWRCPNGHTEQWMSQQHFKGGMFKGDCALSSAVLLSGNNYDKIATLFKIAGMSFPNASLHYKLQSHYAIGVIQTAYQEHESKILDKYKGQEVVIAADGRCDSPGFCAKYLTYTVLHADTKELMLLRVYDKRQTGGKSTAMEVLAMKVIMQILKSAGLTVKEVITDAHLGIAKLIREKHANVHHSFDIWHAAKNLEKKLYAETKKAANAELKPWVPDIVNHLWFTAQHCGGDVERFAEIWCGCLNHVVGIHDWGLDGGCMHQPETESHHKYLQPGGAAHKTLQRIICDSNFQRKFPYLVNARTTYTVEAFQNQILVYASKRIAYRFPAFQARCQLAALDYAENFERPYLYSKKGQPVLHRKYGKQSGRWQVHKTKVKKSCAHLQKVLQQILEAKAQDPMPTARHVHLMEEDPLLIAPTIAPQPPPATSELMATQQSRMRTQRELERRQSMLDQLLTKERQLEQAFRNEDRNDFGQRSSLMPASTNPFDTDDDPWSSTGGQDPASVSTDEIRQMQQHAIREQDQGLEALSHVIGRQKQMALDIGNEVDVHNELIDDITDHTDTTHQRLIRETRHIRIIDRKSSTCCMWVIIILLFIAIVVIAVVPFHGKP